MKYQIKNMLRTSLTIEDAGITLQAAEARVISEQLYLSSKMLKEYSAKKWIQISSFQEPKPMPIWPFSKPAPAPPPPPTTPPVTEEIKALRNNMGSLENRIAELLFALGAPAATTAVTPIPNPQAIRPHGNGRLPTASTDIMPELAEPMFVPSQIVPTTADVRIQVNESESEHEDFDSSLDALKNLRKRK